MSTLNGARYNVSPGRKPVRDPSPNNSAEMAQDILVSIVMTAYNLERYVGAAIRSALDQTLKRIEVIVVDDGSTDRTPEILQGIGDPRLQALRLSHAGPAAALNAGVAQAAGRYVAFLDGDDLWRPEKLERHVSFLESHPGVDLTFDWYRQIDEEGSEIGLGSHRWRGPVSFGQLLVDNVIGSGSSAVIRRGALPNAAPFDTNFAACHDLDLYLRVALQRERNVCSIPNYLTYYRRRTGQLSKCLEVMEASWNQLLVKFRALAPEATQRTLGRARSNMSRFFAYVAYENGNYRRAAGYLAEGFSHAPRAFLSDARNWKLGAGIATARILPANVHHALIRVALRYLDGAGWHREPFNEKTVVQVSLSVPCNVENQVEQLAGNGASLKLRA